MRNFSGVIFALASLVALATSAAATADTSTIGISTTETRERIVIIKGLPYRVGYFCRTTAEAPADSDQVSALTKNGGSDVYWAERYVTAQYAARYQSTWFCTYLRVRQDDDAEPPYDQDSAWLRVQYVGRLLSPLGVPVVRIGNIAEKTANSNGDTLYQSFDKEWYYYFNRHPLRVLDTPDPAFDGTITIYSCISIFKTQFESVILYSGDRFASVPSYLELSTFLIGNGIRLTANNQLLVTPQLGCLPLPPDNIFFDTPTPEPELEDTGSPPPMPPPLAPPPSFPPPPMPPPLAPPPTPTP